MAGDLLNRPSECPLIEKSEGTNMENSEYTMWVLLKKYILTKNSHGKNELLQAMVDIEIKTLVKPEDIGGQVDPIDLLTVGPK